MTKQTLGISFRRIPYSWIPGGRDWATKEKDVWNKSKEMDRRGIENVKVRTSRRTIRTVLMVQGSEKTSSAKLNILSTKAGRMDEAASTEGLLRDDS